MSHHQLSCSGSKSAPGRIHRGRMPAQRSLVRHILHICGLMIEKPDALYIFSKLRKAHRIRAIGIRRHLGMTLGGNTVKSVPVTLYLMPQRESAHPYILRLMYQHGRITLHGMEHYFEIRALSKKGIVELQHGAKRPRAIDIQLPGASVHGHGTQQAEQTEQMVAMYVSYEHRFHLKERYMHTPHLLLSTLPAVNKEQAPMYRQYLSAWISIRNGHSRSCAHYLKSKIHTNYSPFANLSLRAARASISPSVVFSTLALTLLTAFLVFSASVAAALSFTSA